MTKFKGNQTERILLLGNTTISSCPMGLPLALKISEVTPMRDAISVKELVRSKSRKERRIKAMELLHNAHSPLVKYFMVSSKKISTRAATSKT